MTAVARSSSSVVRHARTTSTRRRLWTAVVVLWCLGTYMVWQRIGGADPLDQESWQILSLSSSSNTPSTQTEYVKLTATDYILSHPGWDSSPIVVESHKLVFFTVKKNACTVWKRLMRRMMQHSDWQEASPHDPSTNGLKYLKDYPRHQAEAILNDPLYTKAIFVRDPKERFLSAFLEKSLGLNGTMIVDICTSRTRFSAASIWRQSRTFAGFVKLTRKCKDDHWQPQALRMDPNDPMSTIWKTINFVGHWESIQEDAQRLLRKIGAWDDYGASGWDSRGQHFIFQSMETVSHKSGASQRLAQYYTPQLEAEIGERYSIDYDHPVLGLTRHTIQHPAQ